MAAHDIKKRYIEQKKVFIQFSFFYKYSFPSCWILPHLSAAHLNKSTALLPNMLNLHWLHMLMFSRNEQRLNCPSKLLNNFFISSSFNIPFPSSNIYILFKQPTYIRKSSTPLKKRIFFFCILFSFFYPFFKALR